MFSSPRGKAKRLQNSLQDVAAHDVIFKYFRDTAKLELKEDDIAEITEGPKWQNSWPPAMFLLESTTMHLAREISFPGEISTAKLHSLEKSFNDDTKSDIEVWENKYKILCRYTL